MLRGLSMRVVRCALLALLVAAIALNEILGPLLMKWGLQRAGEIPDRATGP